MTDKTFVCDDCNEEKDSFDVHWEDAFICHDCSPALMEEWFNSEMMD